MNHDDNSNTTNTLAPELEARVVAWIAGEASAFEAAELERLTIDKPEIAIFKRRMQAVQGLLAEAVRPEMEPLRLAPERRAKLLQALGAAEAEPETKAETKGIKPKRLKAPIISMDAVWRAQRKHQKWIFRIAACLVLGLFFAMSIPSFQKVRQSSSRGRGPFLFSMDRNESKEAVQLALPAMERETKDKAGFEVEKAKLEKDVAVREAERMEQVSAEHARRRVQRSATVIPEIADNAVQRQKESDEVRPAERGFPIPGALASAHIRLTSKDIPPSPSVVTKDFMNDIAATSTQSLLQYTSGTEVNGLQGNFSAQAAQAAPAPSVAPAAADDFVVLTPFEISTSTDKGYAAKQTLAGGKLEKSRSLADEAKAADRRSENVPKPVQPAKNPYSPPSFTETITAKEPVSTFSLHVSDVSFKIAKAALANATAIDRERIRPEEFYNAFSYGDPSPALNEKISCHIEQAAHPLLQQRNLVRIAMKVAAAGRGAGQPLRLTVLLDTSGSMEREDRAAAVRRAMQSLVSLLGRNDTVTLIGFARQPRLLAENMAGDKAGELLAILGATPAEGGTNLEEALKLGSELAQRHFDKAAQNRIVLLTDGAANLGNADRTQLAESVEALRQEGIAFDACGVGMEGLDDGMLEALSRKGDGRYYVLNSAEDADAGFAKQLAGALRPAAKNVKVQVRFNPARVGSYRLIGFERHRLREEDFRNDKVDAAELAAEEAAVAVYQVEPLPQGEGELGEVYVRFLDPSTLSMVERSWTLPYDPRTPAFDRASPSMQLAGVAALFAETLQRGEKEDVDRLNELTPVIKALPGHFPNADRVDDLVEMFEKLKKLSAE